LPKFHRIPDLSSIHGSLQIIQTEVMNIGKEITQALSKIREDMTKHISKIQKTMDVAVKVKLLAYNKVDLPTVLRARFADSAAYG
jgi:hypothetical protein